jgi:hypothetical protein
LVIQQVLLAFAHALASGFAFARTGTALARFEAGSAFGTVGIGHHDRLFHRIVLEKLITT